MRIKHGDDVRRLVLVPAILMALTAGSVEAQDHPGKPTYDKWCAGCHGTEGKGDGPAAGYMLPRPRDFTKALYQIRTTASGAIPTDDDIRRIIDEGMPGTAMPGWDEQLTNEERTQLVAYVKTFSRFFQGNPPQALTFASGLRSSTEAIDSGRALFQKMECWKCHGQSGRGDGPSASTQKDDEDFPIRPADLTQPWLFNGGGTAEDIYKRMRTGLDGTPMPSFSDLIDSKILNEDDLWRIAHYVRSLAPAEFPEVTEVVRAARIEGTLPGTPDDSAWNAIQPFYLPLVGQIIVKPRWFSPAVKGVWVQAVHDGNEVALRLSWTDPSKSPDPEWAEWRTLVQSTLEPKEDASAPAATTDPAAAGPSAPGQQPMAPSALPDVMILQFPQSIPSGMERPYFLLGNARDPVYLWRWQSQPEGVTEMLGRGIGRMDPLPDGGVSAQTAFSDGQWRLVVRRSIVAADSANRISFTPGQPIPMALFAWDGDNGETGTRGAISTWYFLFLEQPTSGTVYATPVVAVLLTAGLGLFAIGRAQRKKTT